MNRNIIRSSVKKALRGKKAFVSHWNTQSPQNPEEAKELSQIISKDIEVADLINSNFRIMVSYFMNILGNVRTHKKYYKELYPIAQTTFDNNIGGLMERLEKSIYDFTNEFDNLSDGIDQYISDLKEDLNEVQELEF